MPGVSMRTICAAGVVNTPWMVVLVVCAWRAVMAIFSPTSALRSVDLPAFGRPAIETKPARWLTIPRPQGLEWKRGKGELLRRGVHCRRAPQCECRLAPRFRRLGEHGRATRRPDRRW